MIEKMAKKFSSPDDMLKEMIGISPDEAIKLSLEKAVELQPVVSSYHDKIDTNPELKKKFSQCMLGYIENNWNGKNIKKNHAKAETEEEYKQSLDRFEKELKSHIGSQRMYNNFVFPFMFQSDEMRKAGHLFKYDILLPQDFLDLKISEDKLAHLTIHGLFSRVGSYSNFTNNEDTDKKIFEQYNDNRVKETQQSDYHHILAEIFERLIKEKRYLPSKLRI